MKSKYNKMLKMEKVSDLMKWAHGCLIILLSHFSKYFFFFFKALLHCVWDGPEGIKTHWVALAVAGVRGSG